MILQILNNGGIEASWLMGIMFTIVGFFFVRTLIKIDKRIEDQEKHLQLVTNVLVQILTRLGNDDDFFDNLSNQLNRK